MALKSVAKTKDENKFFTTVGRRKSAVARIKFIPQGKGEIIINGKKLEEYFPTFELQEIITTPLKLLGLKGKTDFSILVRGGGKKGQAEAARLGIARALQDYDNSYRKTLKVAGFLTRDPRVKERKKPGLKRARRAPQWQKR